MTRLDRLRALLVERGIAALYVGDLVNVRYLTGFTGSNGAVLVPADADAVFLTDGRYQDQARAEVEVADHVITRDLTGESRRRGVTHAETHALTVDAWRALGEPAAAGRLVERLREVKDDTEIAHLREACRISVAALEELLAGPLVGRTERDLARDLEHRMVALGAEDKAFDTILASGPHTAIPHHHPTDRVVQPGELLKIDFGARVSGYHADCTRTVVTGTANAWQREVHAVVRASQAAGVAALVAGRPIGDADRAARAVLDDAGWLHAFTTGLGHGVGLQIHEDPFVSAAHPGRLSSRTVLTMEPGIYVPDTGGVRIEDTVLVTDLDHGAPEVLTTTTTELREIT